MHVLGLVILGTFILSPAKFAVHTLDESAPHAGGLMTWSDDDHLWMKWRFPRGTALLSAACGLACM
jgi:hypothetical protein